MSRHSPYDMWFHAAETIGWRLPIIWQGLLRPTAASQAEMSRMVTEKHMAAAEAAMAVQASLLKAAFVPWWMWTARAQQDAMDGMMQVALKPSAKRVKANAARLRRRGLGL